MLEILSIDSEIAILSSSMMDFNFRDPSKLLCLLEIVLRLSLSNLVVLSN